MSSVEHVDEQDGPMINPERSERLGRAVRERRQRIGLTQDRVTANGGPSDRTIRALETGTAGSPGRATLRALDNGLHWDYGTAEQVYRGTMTVSAAVDAREVATVGARPPRKPTLQDFFDQPHDEDEGLIEAPRPLRARAIVARAVADLLALPDPTPDEVKSTEALWRVLSDLMNAAAR